ncbi:hypothetical protein LIA77_11555 [Sarocladium implicatum]|nr:hypothetical protein LIA77_11555 [Sarocladium implicatum]
MEPQVPCSRTGDIHTQSSKTGCSDQLRPNLALFDVKPVPQHASPLCTLLPAEIRQLIWEYVLSDFPDPSPESRYSLMTYYTRPSYEAPRKSDIRLLRTCRAIYCETWTLPLTLREHTWWITSQDRHPRDFRYSTALRKLLASVKLASWAKQQVRAREEEFGCQPPESEGVKSGAVVDDFRRKDEVIEMSSLRVFAQMYKLECGDLDKFLRMTKLHPRTFTLTVRHADWWFWEHDDPLRFEAGWLECVALSLSPLTNEVILELETVSRKKDQLDYIVAHICRTWFFERKDGVVLYGDTTGGSNRVSRWQGASAWHSQRWVRDESAPGKIEYYIVAVPFRPMAVVERRGGKISEELRRGLTYKAKKMRVTAPGTQIAEQGWVTHDTGENDDMYIWN